VQVYKNRVSINAVICWKNSCWTNRLTWYIKSAKCCGQKCTKTHPQAPLIPKNLLGLLALAKNGKDKELGKG
jgi:hypothetical protein